MKIIGAAKEGKYIVEVHGNELANLAGFYWTGADRSPRLVVGAEIQVSEMFRQLYELKNRENALAGMAKDLRLLAELLELKQPIIFPEPEREPREEEG